MDTQNDEPSLILNLSRPGFCDHRVSRLVERPPLSSNAFVHSGIQMVDPQSQATLSRCECGVALPHAGLYYLEKVADDRNNQPRRCGIWVSRIPTSKTLTRTPTRMSSIYWSRVTYLMQVQHGAPLVLAPRTSLLTRSVQTSGNLGLLTIRMGKSGNYRLTSSLRLPRHRWPWLSLSAFLEMWRGS